MISPIMVLAVVQWLVSWTAMYSKQVTVLGGASPMPYGSIFDDFFSTDCRDASDARIDLWGNDFFYQCSVHIRLIAAFLTAVGYSLAPAIAAQIPHDPSVALLGPPNDFEGESDAVSKMTGNREEQ